MQKILISILLLCSSLSLADSLPDPLEAGWKGNKVCEKLHEDEKQRVLRCTFPPGVGHEKHFHAPNVGYTILGGKMQITDASGSRIVEINTGDFHVSQGPEWHEVVNVGDTTLVYLLMEVKLTSFPVD